MFDEFSDLSIYKALKDKESPFIHNIDTLFSKMQVFLPKINTAFSTYTEHGIMHSVHVIKNMTDLLPQDMSSYSDLELTEIIYAGLLHDSGMIVFESEIQRIKNDEDCIGGRKYSIVKKKYNNENIGIRECIRPSHGKRSFDFIMGKTLDDSLFCIPFSSVSFKKDVALICESHTEDFEWIIQNLDITKEQAEYHTNCQFISILLRIGDYLDIDNRRAPDYFFQLLTLDEFSNTEWLQHFGIDNYQKIRNDCSNSTQKEIFFQGETDNPVVHRKLLKYFSYLEKELSNVCFWSKRRDDQKYGFFISPIVINQIKTTGFSFSDFLLSLDYLRVKNILLGENIYGDKKYGLREVIQNSIDACKLRSEEESKKLENTFNPYIPVIRIDIDEIQNIARIVDNGCGMTLAKIKKHFLNVGFSYYSSDDFVFCGYKYNPIGHYGIGFLSCFMLSEQVSVVTKSDNDGPYKLDMNKDSEFITITKENDSRGMGTEITLNLTSFLKAFDSNIAHLKQFVESSFLDCSIKFQLNVLSADSMIKSTEMSLSKLQECLPDTTWFDLSKYLTGIQFKVSIRCALRKKHIANLSDLHSRKSFFFSECEDRYIETDANQNYSKDFLSLSDCIEDHQLGYYSIADTSHVDYDEFSNYYSILNDYDEVIEKLGMNIIDVYTSPSLTEKTNSVMNDYFWGKQFIELEGFLSKQGSQIDKKQMGLSDNLPLLVNFEAKPMIRNCKGKISLPYSINNRFWEFKYKSNAYIRGVKLTKYEFVLPYLIDRIAILGLEINISNPSIFANVARDAVSVDLQKKVNESIARAICLWLLDNSLVLKEDKELINFLISDVYPDKGFCIS